MGKTLPLFIYSVHQKAHRTGQDTYDEDMMLVGDEDETMVRRDIADCIPKFRLHEGGEPIEATALSG